MIQNGALSGYAAALEWLGPPSRSLSPRDHEIIALYKRGESLLTIAERFGVACADVQRTVVRVGDLGRELADEAVPLA